MDAEIRIPRVKICSRCEQRLPIECFNMDRSASDGYTSNCSNCNKLIKAEWDRNQKMIKMNAKALPLNGIEQGNVSASKLIFEEVTIDELKKELDPTNSIDAKYQEANDIIEAMDVGGNAVKIFFKSKRDAARMQSAVNGYAKRQLSNWTVGTNIRPVNQESDVHLYIRKVSKDPDTWGRPRRKRK